MHENFDPSSTISIGSTSKGEVKQILSHHFSTEFIGMAMKVGPHRIVVAENDDYKGNIDKQHDSMYWPILMDITDETTVTPESAIEFTSAILKFLWSKDLPAIASCTFEEELPWSGGIRSPVMPPPSE